MRFKIFLLALVSILIGYLGSWWGFDIHQAIAIAVFSMSILSTLFFWEFRVSFVFIGTGILLLTRSTDIEHVLRFASLDVIFFLIGMMILVGLLKDAGFFFWITSLPLRIKKLTGIKLFILLMAISAFLSCLMDEVTSIIVMTKVVLDISDFLEITPVPLLISCVLATNIGSTGTVIGNPIGVLIAARGNLTFEDFISRSMPVTIVILIITIAIVLYWYRNYIKEVSRVLSTCNEDKTFLYLMSISPDARTKVGMGIFAAAILCIALHHRIESLFGLEENTLLLMAPLIFAGVAMIYRHDKARHFIEKDIEWNSLLFFMFLFAMAGTIRHIGIADFFAMKIVKNIGNSPGLLSGVVLFSSGIISSMLDNVVVVASYIPVIKSLQTLHVNMTPLWWALLFGACYGGNITLIGSTANIVAIGILEKERKIKIGFLEWFWVGLTVGIISMIIAAAAVILLPIYKT